MSNEPSPEERRRDNADMSASLAALLVAAGRQAHLAQAEPDSQAHIDAVVKMKELSRLALAPKHVKAEDAVFTGSIIAVALIREVCGRAGLDPDTFLQTYEFHHFIARKD